MESVSSFWVGLRGRDGDRYAKYGNNSSSSSSHKHSLTHTLSHWLLI